MDAKLIEKLVSEEIRSSYNFTRQGIVTSPGKFEGESIATLYYYDCMLNGVGCIFDVSTEESQAFSIDKKYVLLLESTSGFVSLEYFDFQEDAEKAESEYYNYDAE